MSWEKNDLIPKTEIREKITDATVEFAIRFGEHLATKDLKNNEEPLTTSQLRKFYGEVKRQQLNGYDETQFVMLKPKLAYAVGRAKKNNKIKDFNLVIANAIDCVEESPDKKKAFRNFIYAFEAIVAYHKLYENKNKQ